jgi:ABC-type antimicrobial peptide transport system permease subunit
VDADIPLYWVDTLDARIDESTWFYTVFGTLFMVFGVAALFLASVGLYGVMSFSVSRRTSEVGIRMALGARADQVLSLILRQGLGQIALGLALGLGLAVLLARGVRILLFQVSPSDPLVFASIAALLGLTGLVASLVPARRATRVDPLVALRSE